MLKLKNKNGITLIALIITIIVMLILVGVTLNMVLDENGIIAEAKKAKEKMEGAAQAETLQTSVLGAIGADGKIDFSKLDGYEGATETYHGRTTGTYIINGRVYTVDENGNVTDITELAKYLLGEDLQGRYLLNVEKLDAGEEDENAIISVDFETGDFICIKDPYNSNSIIHEEITLHLGDDIYEEIISYISDQTMELYNGMIIVLQYKGNYYYIGITVDDTTQDYYSVGESIFKVYTGISHLGKYVRYKGYTWIVFKDDSEEVNLVCTESMGSVTIGNGDASMAVEDCKNAWERMNQECMNATGITENIRSINYSDILNTTFNSIDGIYSTGNDYWLGATYTQDKSTYINYIDSNGSHHWETIADATYVEHSVGYYYSGYIRTHGVRPVLTLPAGALDNISGDGTTLETAIPLD